MKTNPPGTVLVSEAALNEVGNELRKCDHANSKTESLFYLLQQSFSVEGRDGIMSDGERDRLHCGIMHLCDDLAAELHASNSATFAALREVKGLK